MMPAVDVLILSWNRVDATLETIANVRDQVGVDLKVWVVDQGSDSESLDALRALAERGEIILHELGRNVGVPAGRNIGMALGSAAYIVSVDNDAVFGDRRALARVVARFEADPSLAAIGFRIDNYFSGGLDHVSWVYPRTQLSMADESFVTTRIAGGGNAIRRAALNKTDGYEDRLFFYWEELDLTYQFIENGYTILYDPSVVLRHKVSPEARTDWTNGRFYYLVRNGIYVRYKHFRSIPQSLMFAIGYMVKAGVNGVPGQALRGIVDSVKMISSLKGGRRLGADAIGYIRENEMKYRGGLLKRIKDEVLAHMP